jgi:hypothetical protein
VRAAFAVASLLLCAAASYAQEQTIRIGREADSEEVEIAFVPASPPRRLGALGFVQLRVKNLDAVERDVRVGFRDGWGNDVSAFAARRNLRLAAGETAVVTLPVPATENGLRLDASVDGRERGRAYNMLTTNAGMTLGGAPAGLVVAERKEAVRLATELNAKAGGSSTSARHFGGTDLSAFAQATPDELPEHWTLLTRNDAIFLDLETRDLDAVRQQAISDWVSSGGELFAFGGASPGLPEGPLKELLQPELGAAKATPPTHRHGAGAWRVYGNRPAALYLHDALVASRTEQSRGAAVYGGFPQDGWLARLVIPGLGRVPVRLFLGLLGAYLLFVGWQTRRMIKARRPERLLVFLPAAGLLMTVAILAYGIVSEGLGTKGAARSFTLLDQRARTATSFTTRTLYAGLEPARLDAGLKTLTIAPAVHQQGVEAAHRQIFDLDRGGGFDGSLLPARRPTVIGTVTVDRARDRLRFKRRDDGGLDVLAEPGLKPRADAPLVVRDGEGTWFAGLGTGPLKRMTHEEASQALDAAVAYFASTEVVSPRDEQRSQGGFGFGRRRVFYPVGSFTSYPSGGEPDAPGSPAAQKRLHEWVREQAVAVVRQGGWCGVVEATPAFVGGLGLDTEWKSATHVVAGTLAEDDVGR